MSDLQLSLIGVGAAVVVLVVLYNKWQERKHRLLAERVFRGDHPDVLLEGARGAPADPATGRIEPAEMTLPEVEEIEAAPAPEPDESGSAQWPGEPPPQLADERIDCVVSFESAETIATPQLWQAHQQAFIKLARPLRWLALDEKCGEWVAVPPHGVGGFHRLRAAIQLADRRGALTDAEFTLLSNGIQRLADEFLAVADVPARNDVLERAATLDRFCAGVDVQIAVNVVSRDGHGFAGTKLRGLAEAAGMTLRDDGSFHAMDEEGVTLFTLGNLEPALFAADDMKTLATHGLTFTLDVPRVARGAAVFDQMIRAAAQFAHALGGLLVDDNRAPLTDAALEVIRKSITQFQEQMERNGVPAGGPLAQRLFA